MRLALFLAVLAAAPAARAAPVAIDSFDTPAGAAAWRCAAWAEATLDASGAPAAPHVSAGALFVPVRFLGQGYAQGYVGRDARISFAGAAVLALDVTLPPEAPDGLRAKPILLLGPAAAWTEPVVATPLAAGATTSVRLPLAASWDPPFDRALLRDVRGIGLKIEARGVRWCGEIAIEEVRLEDAVGPAPDDLAARPVGTFGGFIRKEASARSEGANPPSAAVEIPRRNGFLTFVADAEFPSQALLWPKLGPQGKDFVLGTMRFPGIALGKAEFFVLDWTTIEARARLATWRGIVEARALFSRAFPAVRYETGARSFTFGRAARLIVVLDGRPALYDVSRGGTLPLDRMSEPWALLYALSPDAAPVLLSFERRPLYAEAGSDGVTFRFAGAAGAVNVMPLDGLRRPATGEMARWDAGIAPDLLVRCRALVPVLAAFPVGCEERATVDDARGVIAVTDEYGFREIRDDWGTVPLRVAPVPPVIYRAGSRGYPVSYPSGAPVETRVATWFGPFAYIPGERATYEIPLPAGTERIPVALCVEGDPDSAGAREEVLRLIREETPAQLAEFFLDNDDRVAAFLAEALPALPPGGPERAIAASFATRAIEHGFLDASLQVLEEPVTGQRYLNSAKYWASQEPFDKEWYNGRQLAALALAAEAFDLDLARALWPKALGLYRYDRIFFDWATGSVLSSCFGLTALADGIHFAWEGMVSLARLARILGDEATYRDACWHAARQQAALFAAWHQADWAREIDYAIGHISDARLSPAHVETRGAIDGFVEEFGCATLEFRSFWQTTNFLFYDCVPQFSFYRDFGLEARVRDLEYAAMPAAHPLWTDGNALEPVDGRYYGGEFTAAHLFARAALFHDNSAALFAAYCGSAGTEASRQWYSMRRLGIAGPLLLAIERARAPLVEFPAALGRLESARFDARTRELALEIEGRKDASAKIRIRPPGGASWEERVALRAKSMTVVRISVP
jgi:hypothetical protein